MNEKAQMTRRGARRSASAATILIQPPNKMETGKKSVGSDADVDASRDFHDRQARTDAAVRTIPGLHKFGN